MGALASLLLTVFKSQGNTTNRISGSISSQIASSLLDKDVENAAFISTQSTPSCGTTGTQILGLNSQGNQVFVSYVTVANGSKYSLFRRLCTGSITTTAVADQLISDNVPGSQSASVSCAPTLTCTPSTGWISAAGVSKVSISVIETATGATYQMAAVPRAWTAASAGIAVDPFPIAPFTLLGSGSCPQTVLTMTGGSRVSISGGNGPVLDDSSCSPSVSLSGSVTITGSNFYTANTTPANTVTIVKQGAVYPAPTYRAPAADPLASVLTAPSNPSTGSTGSCPASGVSGTCTPGNFASAVLLNGSSNVTFSSGTYVFNAPVTISNGATAAFQGGTFWFKQGLTISGSAPVTFAQGTYIFDGATSSSNALTDTASGSITSGTGGTLFYVKSGKTTFSGAGVIALAGEAQFYGAALWQDSSDSNAIALGGSSAVNAAYGGIYAPAATVTSTGTASMSASYVVVGSASLSGSAALFIG